MTVIPFLTNDDKNQFTVFMGRSKAGATLEDILAYMPGLAGIELRVEGIDDGFTNVWANTEQYHANNKAAQKTSDKKSLQEYFKLLPILIPLYLGVSALIGGVVALKIGFLSLFFQRLEGVNAGTAFVVVFAACSVLFTLQIAFTILNKGRA